MAEPPPSTGWSSRRCGPKKKASARSGTRAAVAGDPLVAMALAGRTTTTLELGTAVLQTYTSHPALMANRVLAAASAMGRNGFTLGIGPSHEVVIEGSFGISYSNAGRHTEEYVTILTQLLHGEAVEFVGDDFEVRLAAPATADGVTVPVLVAALGRRLLRVAGAVGDGTILWMANAQAVETHVTPLIRAAADEVRSRRAAHRGRAAGRGARQRRRGA